VRREELKNANTIQEKESLKNALSIIDNKHYKAKEWIKNNLNAKMEDIPLENPHPSGYIAGREAAKNLSIAPKQPKLPDST